MRLMPLSYVKPGMVLARDLVGKNHSLLLAAGYVLTEQSIQRVQTMQYQAVYIHDSFDDSNEDADGDIDEPINERLRTNAIQSVRSFFYYAQHGNIRLSQEAVLSTKKIVYEMVGEISTQRHATANMTDLKLFDDYTYYHSVNVSVISIVLGVAMRLPRATLLNLGLGAMLHDIGKIYIPKTILDKPGKLTPEEFREVSRHSSYGYDYLKQKWDVPIDSSMAVLLHHEKFDGSGYPHRICGEEIPLFARIVAVADVYDALTSKRPYRNALSASEALEFIMGNSGNHFDPTVVDAFVQKVELYPVGTHVRLSNGEKGIVAKNYPKCAMRPMIRLLTDSKEEIYYDLANDMSLLDLYITGIVYS